MRLGCVAGGLMEGLAAAAALTREGLPATVLRGAQDTVPVGGLPLVVCLDPAVPDAGAAAAWLQQAGCERFVFAHGARFDSGDEGAVLDALIEALGCGFALVCPATPEAGFTVYQGHLFEGAALRVGEGNLVRGLSRQTDGTVGLIAHATVVLGPDGVRRAATGLKEQGRRYGLVDALSAADLDAAAVAGVRQTLMAGTGGLAAALARAGRMGGMTVPAPAVTIGGGSAILAVSSARTTLFQLGQAKDRFATLALDPVAMPGVAALTAAALAFADGQRSDAPLMITMTQMPDAKRHLDQSMGEVAADALLRQAAATIAEGLVERGVRRLFLAGDMAAEMVLERLGVTRLTFGQEIDPGLHWMLAEGRGPDLVIAVKADAAGGAGVIGGAFDVLGLEFVP